MVFYVTRREVDEIFQQIGLRTSGLSIVESLSLVVYAENFLGLRGYDPGMDPRAPVECDERMFRRARSLYVECVPSV